MKPQNNQKQEVETLFFDLPTSGARAFQLRNASSPIPLRLAYEAYGQLNQRKDNAILIFHAFTGSQHVMGINQQLAGVVPYWTQECQTGWWSRMVGPGLCIDTQKYFVICANYLGSCYGSSGPSSIGESGTRERGPRFPQVTLADIVDSQVLLLKHLGIQQLHAVIGASIGGLLALDLSVRHPGLTKRLISIASAGSVSNTQKLSIFEQTYAIRSDPEFRAGDYYGTKGPQSGLALARMIAHKSYISPEHLNTRARAEVLDDRSLLQGYVLDDPLQSYLVYQGQKFIQRFDPNSYLQILEAWRTFEQHTFAQSLEKSRRFLPLKNIPCLIFSIDSDICFLPQQQQELHRNLVSSGVTVEYQAVKSRLGHDSFLVEPDLYSKKIEKFLMERQSKRHYRRQESAACNELCRTI